MQTIVSMTCEDRMSTPEEQGLLHSIILSSRVVVDEGLVGGVVT